MSINLQVQVQVFYAAGLASARPDSLQFLVVEFILQTGSVSYETCCLVPKLVLISGIGYILNVLFCLTPCHKNKSIQQK